MDPDEPVIALAKEGDARLIPQHTAAAVLAAPEPATHVADTYEDDDDDDGAASVGRPAVEDEEEEDDVDAGGPGANGAAGLTSESGSQAATSAAGDAATARTGEAVADSDALPSSSAQTRDDGTPPGESVEAIEAAVASLALTQRKASQRNIAATATAVGSLEDDAAPSEATAAAAGSSTSSGRNSRRATDSSGTAAAPAAAAPATGAVAPLDAKPASTSGADDRSATDGQAAEAEPAAAAAAAATSTAPAADGDAERSAVTSGSGAAGTAVVAEQNGESEEDEEEASTQWSAYPKHFFILSSSGKPIYSYTGDERSLVGLTALISALVSVVQAQGDSVQSIRSGATLIVFLLRGPLVLVAASSCGEPASALRRQLELLHGQLVLVVTSGLERIIQRNPSYDVRSLLDGVGGVMSSLVRMLAADPAYLLQAHRPLPLPAADRSAATELLTEALRQCGGVYALLMADTHVVALCRGRAQPPPHPDDLLLLANFIMCNNAYRNGHGEAFSPVCLPHYNADAFLHAHIHYLDPNTGLYLVLLAGSAEAFHALSAARAWFEEQAAARGLMPRLRALRPPQPAYPTATAMGPAAAEAAAGAASGSGSASGQGAGPGAGRGRALPPPQHLNVLCVENLPRPLGGKFGHTALWSYAVRFGGLQQAVFSPPSCPLHRSPEGAAKLAAAYAQLHSLLHSPAATKPNKLAWFADSSCVLVAARGDMSGLMAGGGGGGGGVSGALSASLGGGRGGGGHGGPHEAGLELYAVCDPLTDKATALSLLEALRRHFGDRGIAADVTLPPAPA
ncbi:hypothetical protein HYH02_000788 [Chlamydomonas schloesseri]|uniref:Vacuolar fusion protein MON1 homolog n=1 Tax=Chlamydomonas schloesseri TaxID=2026947 RepID=A0A835WVU1_9CHLO|nr:hypothetical protein HYH02_000788 [Chlamydomonas schloesseri]|eukprot:KAG2454962.1 hypothetical protein HYH02_000788 [Chlamydomonas schloesseri]